MITIDGFENYCVDKHGNIWNKKRKKILKQHVRKDGYAMVSLYKNGKQHVKYAHRIIAEAYHGPILMGLVVNHKDGNKSNNIPSNLEIITPKENVRHAVETGLIKITKDRYLKISKKNRKINEEMATQIRELASKGMSFRKIAAKFGVCHKTISSIVNQVSEFRNRPDNRVLGNKHIDRSSEKDTKTWKTK